MVKLVRATPLKLEHSPSCVLCRFLLLLGVKSKEVYHVGPKPLYSFNKLIVLCRFLSRRLPRCFSARMLCSCDHACLVALWPCELSSSGGTYIQNVLFFLSSPSGPSARFDFCNQRAVNERQREVREDEGCY